MAREVGVVPQSFLPRSVAGRGILLVLSASAIAVASVFLFTLAVGPIGLSWGEWLLRLGMFEFIVVLFVIGWVGLLWAVAAPRWLPALALQVGRWIAVCLSIPWVIMIGLMLWPW